MRARLTPAGPGGPPAPVPTAGPRRPGVVILEFALVAVLLVFLILGMVEVSRGVMVKETLSNAARSGCRMACGGQVSNAPVIDDVRAVLTDNGLDGGKATVTILVNDKAGDVAAARRYDKIAVTVALPVSEVYWTSTLFLKETSTTAETVVMMRQG